MPGELPPTHLPGWHDEDQVFHHRHHHRYHHRRHYHHHRLRCQSCHTAVLVKRTCLLGDHQNYSDDEYSGDDDYF